MEDAFYPVLAESATVFITKYILGEFAIFWYFSSSINFK